MQLHRFAVVWFSVAWLAGPLFAQDELPPAESGAIAKETQEKASYAFGYSSGKSLRETLRIQEATVLVESWIKGFRDAMDGKKAAYADDELRKAVADYQRSSLTKLAKKNKQDGDVFLKENAKKEGVVTLKSGLQYEVLKQGRGPSPGPTDVVRARYQGTLIDGTVFDSSGQEPFVIGVNEVIPGWTEALQRMKVGDKWRIVVPSKLAYGANGAGSVIGPNAVLVFELELLGVEPSSEPAGEVTEPEGAATGEPAETPEN